MTSILELSLSGHHKEAAEIWAKAVCNFHGNTPDGITIFDADGPIRNLASCIENNLVPQSHQTNKHLFNLAANLHSEISEFTLDRHVPLYYHAHHYNFNDNGNLVAQSYAVSGPAEREAPAFIYNPVSPSDPRFEEMRSLAMSFDEAKAKTESIALTTGWDTGMITKLNFIRSVENWANRLIEESKNQPKEIPPYGQVDSKYWEEYTHKVAIPLVNTYLPRLW